MAKRQSDLGLRQYAVMGAEQRLLQIAEEAARIFTAFPELRDRGFMAPGADRGEGSRPKGRRVRRRGTISAEGRRRISEAQKARWAKLKRKKK
jgi:hypothetical protein